MRLDLYILIGAAAVFTATIACAGEPLTFDLPVKCDMQKVCSIHKYVDHDPSPERKDYACGRLSLDGDMGTDFRTPSYVEMNRGVEVIAAAPGRVLAVRDGMQDVSVRKTGWSAIKGREAGNGVVIDHGGGWHTQYSHLMQNSITVSQGDVVTAGQTIGQIGLSGNTEFPHLEFSVRHHGRPVDPFVSDQPVDEKNPWQCGGPRRPMWTEDAQAVLAYRASGILSAGFAPVPVIIDTARQGGYGQTAISNSSPALIVWADVFGAQAGDEQVITITNPAGVVIHRSEQTLEKNNIAWFAWSGKKRPREGWPIGDYSGSYQLTRDGKAVAKTMTKITVTDR